MAGVSTLGDRTSLRHGDRGQRWLGAYKRRTIVGDAVNFASRVEAANKNVGTSSLISEDAYEQAGQRGGG